MKNITAPLVFTIAILLVTESHAQTFRMVPSQHPTIQSAISVSSHGDVIVVAPGTYNENINYAGKGLRIISPMGPEVTTIRGNMTSRVVTFDTGVPSTAALNGFTITNGTGGILIKDCSPKIKNCIIRNNFTTTNSGGAGILIEAHPNTTTAPIVEDCQIKNNQSIEAGGGIMVDVYNYGGSAGSTFPLIRRCEISGNFASGGISNPCTNSPNPCSSYGGGGISLIKRATNGNLSATLLQCHIFNNGTEQHGGGISMDRVDLCTIKRCRIENNVCGGASGSDIPRGAGIGMRESSADVSNTLLAKNQAVESGGAIFFEAFSSTGSLTVTSCTITDNFSPDGGGIKSRGMTSTTIADTVLWGNMPIDLTLDSAATVTATYTNFGTGPVGSSPTNLSLDPLFIDPTNGDYHLSRNSPCVDAGDPLASTTVLLDFDDGARISNGTIDIGVDEVPLAILQGSNEDLEFHTLILNGLEDPNATTINLTAGDVLMLRLASPGGTFVGNAPLIVGQAYTTGFPPMSPPGLPGIHLDGFGGITVVYGDTSGTFLMGPSLPIEGVILYYLVPFGLGGNSFRIQGFAVTNTAANGMYAVTEAHDLVF